VAPGALPFRPDEPAPEELSRSGIQAIVGSFVDAAQRALAAGFEVAEIHTPHGYLAHQFLSPLSNQRTGEYGGSFENRVRFVMEVAEAVRSVWPARLPLFARLPVTDWVWREAGTFQTPCACRRSWATPSSRPSSRRHRGRCGMIISAASSFAAIRRVPVISSFLWRGGGEFWHWLE
jgi:2,4-dienoyl-CoA reductase-like NADH-dependent reductase (Old Yellow Enzyme family)